MAFKLFSKVALAVDVSSHKFRKGDVATIVEAHAGHPGEERGYSLEVFNAVGDTLAVVIVRESQIESLTNNEILHVRRLDEALS
jgi:hypothetical protein